MTDNPVAPSLIEAAKNFLVDWDGEENIAMAVKRLRDALPREKSIVARREAVIEAARKKPRPDVRVEYPLFCSSKEPRIIVTYDASIEEALKAYDDSLKGAL